MKKRSSRIFEYLLVAGTGLLVIFLTLLLTEDRRSPVPPETASSSWEETVSDVPETPETEKEPETAANVPSSSETASAKETDRPVIPSSAYPTASYEILDSRYQYAQGYVWEDLYALLVLIVKTSNIPEGFSPAFSLIRFSSSTDPLLFVGYKSKTEESVLYTVYATDRGYVYELGKIEGSFRVSPREQAVFMNDKKEKLLYLPHVFLRSTNAPYPEDLTDPVIHDLEGRLISAEELITLVQDLTKGGASHE